jgi:hypothetical protein
MVKDLLQQLSFDKYQIVAVRVDIFTEVAADFA